MLANWFKPEENKSLCFYDRSVFTPELVMAEADSILLQGRGKWGYF